MGPPVTQGIAISPTPSLSFDLVLDLRPPTPAHRPRRPNAHPHPGPIGGFAGGESGVAATNERKEKGRRGGGTRPPEGKGAAAAEPSGGGVRRSRTPGGPIPIGPHRRR